MYIQLFAGFLTEANFGQTYDWQWQSEMFFSNESQLKLLNPQYLNTLKEIRLQQQ
jgi:hypothetical protein